MDIDNYADITENKRTTIPIHKIYKQWPILKAFPYTLSTGSNNPHIYFKCKRPGTRLCIKNGGFKFDMCGDFVKEGFDAFKNWSK